MVSLKLTKRGNSLGITIPKEMLAAMNVGEGDELFVTKTPKGYEISPKDPDFEKKMVIARRCMKEYRDTLSELAK